MRILRSGSVLCILGASSALVSGCAPPLRPAGCPANPAQQLLMEINAVRTREGALPLWPNIQLARAAQGHAQALADGEASGHFGADGSDPLQRITDAGYLPNAFGEDIAMGSAAPRLIVEAWMRSPAHRQVLLDPSLREVGLGGISSPDKPIWVADFGARAQAAETRCHPWTTPSTAT